jgi:hypothetical protein
MNKPTDLIESFKTLCGEEIKKSVFELRENDHDSYLALVEHLFSETYQNLRTIILLRKSIRAINNPYQEVNLDHEESLR